METWGSFSQDTASFQVASLWARVPQDCEVSGIPWPSEARKGRRMGPQAGSALGWLSVWPGAPPPPRASACTTLCTVPHPPSGPHPRHVAPVLTAFSGHPVLFTGTAPWRRWQEVDLVLNPSSLLKNLCDCVSSLMRGGGGGLLIAGKRKRLYLCASVCACAHTRRVFLSGGVEGS